MQTVIDGQMTLDKLPAQFRADIGQYPGKEDLKESKRSSVR